MAVLFGGGTLRAYGTTLSRCVMLTCWPNGRQRGQAQQPVQMGVVAASPPPGGEVWTQIFRFFSTIGAKRFLVTT